MKCKFAIVKELETARLAVSMMNTEEEFLFIFEVANEETEEDKIYEFFGMARGKTENDFIFTDLQKCKYKAWSIGPVPFDDWNVFDYLYKMTADYIRSSPEIHIGVISTFNEIVPDSARDVMELLEREVEQLLPIGVL